MTLAEEIEARLPAPSRHYFGQVFLSRDDDGVFSACHCDDREERSGLIVLNSVAELREMARYDQTGDYRPLKTAPNLKSGWFTSTADPVQFLKRLDAIYPGVFATWVSYENGDLNPTPLRSTLDRQTGYRFAGTISDQMANRIMRELCSPGCLRKIAWPLSHLSPVSRIKRDSTSLPLICTEACTLAVGLARTLAKEAYDKENAPTAN